MSTCLTREEEKIRLQQHKQTQEDDNDSDFSQLSLFRGAPDPDATETSFSVKDSPLLPAPPPAIAVGQEVLPKRGFPHRETPQGRLVEHGAPYLSAVELLSLFVGGRDPAVAQRTATDIISHLNKIWHYRL